VAGHVVPLDPVVVPVVEDGQAGLVMPLLTTERKTWRSRSPKNILPDPWTDVMILKNVFAKTF
jgi:hypothetical protein